MSIYYAELVEELASHTRRCLVCPWQCELAPTEVGRCRMRVGTAAGIEILNYGMISAAAIGPIEDHRLWHFFPDSLALSIGGWGYTFATDQQRGAYADFPEDPNKRRRLDPDRAANFALERLCRGVIWAYGDPAASYEYLLSLLQLSRAASRYTALIGTGHLTENALDELGPYLDGFGFELRGFSDGSYERLSGVADWTRMLAIAERAKHRWNCHIEVTTRIHHGVNDDPTEIAALVNWISETLGPQTPWHVLPGDAGSETAAAVVRARRIGLESNLAFVYGPEPNQPTRCPDCQQTLITRNEGITRMVGLNGSVCTDCGYNTRIHRSIFKQR
jgi:pyruvate formate lyase activating enzyme